MDRSSERLLERRQRAQMALSEDGEKTQMIPGNLEILCLGTIALLLLLLAFLIVLALLKRATGAPEIPGRLLTREKASPMSVDTVMKLNYYYPLPEGFAYTEDEDGAPTVVRVDDGISLPHTVEADRLTFEEPYLREDGTGVLRTYEVFRRGHYTSVDQPVTHEA